MGFRFKLNNESWNKAMSNFHMLLNIVLQTLCYFHISWSSTVFILLTPFLDNVCFFSGLNEFHLFEFTFEVLLLFFFYGLLQVMWGFWICLWFFFTMETLKMFKYFKILICICVHLLYGFWIFKSRLKKLLFP